MLPSNPIPTDSSAAAAEQANLDERLLHLRSSLDARVDELSRRTTKLRQAMDLPEHIKQEPLKAVAIGLAVGGVAALLMPGDRAPSGTPVRGMVGGLLSALALKAGRQLLSELAGRAYRTYMAGHPQLEVAPSSTLHSRGPHTIA
jgi:ElaB/YqjD/DUF883 family membrane-anchored ribosome-binding protein